jgi:hypothetical protein
LRTGASSRFRSDEGPDPPVRLARSLTFLASLFLSWIQSGVGTNGVLRVLDETVSYDAWGPYGQVAALVALALAAAVGASLVRPQLKRRLPFASAGMALLYLALLNAAYLHGFAVFRSAYDHVPVRLGPGAYLGLACAIVVFLAAVATSWEELPPVSGSRPAWPSHSPSACSPLTSSHG